MRNAFLVCAVLVAVAPACSGSESGGGSGGGQRSSGSESHQPGHVLLTIWNNTGQEVCYLYLSPVANPQWGPDQLKERTLQPNERDQYAVPSGQWDIKAEDCSHTEMFVLRNTTLHADSTLVLPPRGSR